jgi:hypothetical protein
VLIAVLNAQFHLFQEAINQFTAVIVLENTNQMILVMIDHHETTEVQDIPETTEVEDHHMGVIHLDLVLDQVEEKVINF